VSTREAAGRRAPPPDYARARVADETAQRFKAAHPAAPIRPPTEEELRALPTPPSFPDERFLSDPRLAVRVGMVVADVTFLSAGERDEYALDTRRRFLVPTTRYRVRINAAVRVPGQPTPSGEIDLYAREGFVLPVDRSGAAPRMLMVLGDHSLRPGFNVKVATPIDDARGSVLAAAFGAPAGASVGDVLRGLAVEARAGGAS